MANGEESKAENPTGDLPYYKVKSRNRVNILRKTWVILRIGTGIVMLVWFLYRISAD